MTTERKRQWTEDHFLTNFVFQLLQHQIGLIHLEVPKAWTSMSSLLFQITADSNWKQLKKALSWNRFLLCDSLPQVCRRYLQLLTRELWQATVFPCSIALFWSISPVFTTLLLAAISFLLAISVFLCHCYLPFFTCNETSFWNSYFLPLYPCLLLWRSLQSQWSSFHHHSFALCRMRSFSADPVMFPPKTQNVPRYDVLHIYSTWI